MTATFEALGDERFSDDRAARCAEVVLIPQVPGLSETSWFVLSASGAVAECHVE